MADVKFEMGLDTRGDAGTLIEERLIATLQGQGHTPTIVKRIRDPITDKLSILEMSLAESGSDDAVSAIAANSGIVTTTPPLPTPLFTFDATDMSATILDLAVRSPTVRQEINYNAQNDALAGGAVLGSLRDTGGGDVFVDGSTNIADHPFTALRITHENSTPGTLTLQPSDLVITADGQPPLTIANALPLDVTVQAAGELSRKVVYVDVAGKIYLAFHIEGLNIIVGPRTFAASIVANPGGL